MLAVLGKPNTSAESELEASSQMAMSAKHSPSGVSISYYFAESIRLRRPVSLAWDE